MRIRSVIVVMCALPLVLQFGCASSSRPEPATNEHAVSREKILIHIYCAEGDIARNARENYSLARYGLLAAKGGLHAAESRGTDFDAILLLDMPLHDWMLADRDNDGFGSGLVNHAEELGRGTIHLEWASRGSMPRDRLPTVVEGISVVEFPVDRIAELVSQGYVYIRM